MLYHSVMAIDTISVDSGNSYVRIARGDHTAAYLHEDHMSIPCEDDATLDRLVAALKDLPPRLTLEIVHRDDRRPIVRIFW